MIGKLARYWVDDHWEEVTVFGTGYAVERDGTARDLTAEEREMFGRALARSMVETKAVLAKQSKGARS